MAGDFAPSSLVNASRRVWIILGWSSVVSAFSLATRQVFSLGLRLWCGVVGLGLNGIDVSFWVYDLWRFLARYGVWIQLGRIGKWLLGDVCRCALAL